jgi:hypothetical protein
MGKWTLVLWVTATALAAVPARASVSFDFENVSAGTTLPMSVTVDGLTAQFTPGQYGYSIEDYDVVFGIAPVGFSGHCIYPRTVYQSDLTIGFDRLLSGASILVADQEMNMGTAAVMQMRAYLDTGSGSPTLVWSTTSSGDPDLNWPSSTLSYSSASPFNLLVVHYYQHPTPGNEGWGPIFMADNLQVTVVPEPVSVVFLGMAGLALLLRRRR